MISPDMNFILMKKRDDIDSPLYSQDQLIQFSIELNKQIFSIFYLNIRSLNKNIENL